MKKLLPLVALLSLPALAADTFKPGIRLTDGVRTVTLLSSAPGSDTGQVAVPVRVISSLAGGSGGTSSNFGAAFPSAGTAAGFSDGTNLRGALVYDTDTGGGTQYTLGVVLRVPGSGGSSTLSATGTSLDVNCTGGCGGASSFLDNAAFTPGTTAVNVMAGEVDDTATSAASENSAGAVRMTTQRGLHTNLRNASGTEVGTSGAPLRVDPTGSTTQPVSGTVTANQGGTWTVQPGNTANTTAWLMKLDQTSTNNDVDVSTLPNVTVGTFPDNEPFNVAQVGGTAVVTGGVNGSLGVGGNIAHDGAISSATNPVRIGVRAEAEGAALQAVSAEDDMTDLKADLTGRLLVRTHHPNHWVASSFATTATTLTEIKAAPGASTSLYITDITFSSSAASTTTTDQQLLLKEGTGTNCGTGTATKWAAFNPANGGAVATFTTPIKLTANNALCFIAAAAGTKHVVVNGYTAP